MRHLSVAALVLLVGCGSNPVEPPAVGPYFRGVLTQVEQSEPAPTIMVTDSLLPVEECAKSLVFHLKPRTPIMLADGTPGQVADLAVGLRVRIWMGPHLLLSCPAIGSPTRVEIE